MILEDLQKQNEELENKNTHLNQAIHEEQEAILELRVQLRLLQSHKLQQELTVQPSAEQTPAAQPSPEARSEEQAKRSVTAAAASADSATAANGKTAKDPSKPSPSKDRREPNMWDVISVVFEAIGTPYISSAGLLLFCSITPDPWEITRCWIG